MGRLKLLFTKKSISLVLRLMFCPGSGFLPLLETLVFARSNALKVSLIKMNPVTQSRIVTSYCRHGDQSGVMSDANSMTILMSVNSECYTSWQQ